MPKTQPLCPGAKLNLRDRVLGEVEKKSFIDLPSKGGHSRLVPSKPCVPTPGGFSEEFYSYGSRLGVWVADKDQSVCRACIP